MSIGNINISDSEMEIMAVLWNAKEPLTSIEIGEAVEKHGWKKTTIATFLDFVFCQDTTYNKINYWPRQ